VEFINPPEPDGLAGVAAQGDYAETLRALRDRLAAEIDVCASGRDLAALSLRLTDVLSLLKDLPNGEEVSAADEIARRRDARRTTAARKTGAPRG